MFGVGLYSALDDYAISWLGGTKVSVVITLTIRLLVGIGWYKMFKNVGKKGWMAFVPMLGEFQAFRLVWDDFSFAAIFAGTTFVAWVGSVGIEHPIVFGCTVANTVLWWIMSILTSVAYQTSIVFGLLYGLVPWAGALVFGWSQLGDYQGPWSSNPPDSHQLKPGDGEKTTARSRKKGKGKRKG